MTRSELLTKKLKKQKLERLIKSIRSLSCPSTISESELLALFDHSAKGKKFFLKNTKLHNLKLP